MGQAHRGETDHPRRRGRRRRLLLDDVDAPARRRGFEESQRRFGEQRLERPPRLDRLAARQLAPPRKHPVAVPRRDLQNLCPADLVRGQPADIECPDSVRARAAQAQRAQAEFLVVRAFGFGHQLEHRQRLGRLLADGPLRLLEGAVVDAEARDLVAGEPVDLVGRYLGGRVEQGSIDAHPPDVVAQLAIERGELGVLPGCRHLDAAVTRHADELARMHAEPGAGRHLPDLGADQRIDAGRVAAAVHRPQLGRNLLSHSLHVAARLVAVAGRSMSDGAAGRNGLGHAGRHLPLAHEPADGQRLALQTARGMEENRQLARGMGFEKSTQALGRANAEKTLRRNPFAAAFTARVVLAPGEVEQKRRPLGHDLFGARRRLRGSHAGVLRLGAHRQTDLHEGERQKQAPVAHHTTVRTEEAMPQVTHLQLRFPWSIGGRTADLRSWLTAADVNRHPAYLRSWTPTAPRKPDAAAPAAPPSFSAASTPPAAARLSSAPSPKRFFAASPDVTFLIASATLVLVEAAFIAAPPIQPSSSSSYSILCTSISPAGSGSTKTFSTVVLPISRHDFLEYAETSTVT